MASSGKAAGVRYGNALPLDAESVPVTYLFQCAIDVMKGNDPRLAEVGRLPGFEIPSICTYIVPKRTEAAWASGAVNAVTHDTKSTPIPLCGQHVQGQERVASRGRKVPKFYVPST